MDKDILPEIKILVESICHYIWEPKVYFLYVMPAFAA